MANFPQLNIFTKDRLISTGLFTFSPFPSQIGSSAFIGTQSVAASPMSMGGEHPVVVDPSLGENEPLLGANPQKPFYRARPLWLVPFAIASALVRGMTLAPRVEVFTHLSCNALHHHYNRSSYPMPPAPPSRLPHPVTSTHNPLTPFYFSLDPLGPHLHPPTLEFSPLPPHLPSSSSNHSTTIFRIHDSSPSPQCISDPAVQARAAHLQTVMTIAMGLLSALTTSWWGHFSERHGRTTVLALSTLGLFITDLAFILLSTPSISSFFSPSHTLLILLLGHSLEGLLGGWSSLQSACSAYISDCTSSGSRAHIFSRFTGVFYLGLSVGPAVGGWLLRHPICRWGSGEEGGVTGVFWVAAMCSLVNFLLVLLIFPESLSEDSRIKAVFEYTGERKGKSRGTAINADEGGVVVGDEEGSGSVIEEGERVAVGEGGGIIKAFLSPLAVFFPVVIMDGPKKQTDWSLTFLAGALFAYMLSTGVMQIKYLYAEHVYGWGAEQLGYYISFLSGIWAVHLLFILPIIIDTFKPSRKPTSHTTAKPQPFPKRSKIKKPLIPPPTRESTKPTRAHLSQEIQFDLTLTRLSLILDIISNALVAIAPLTSYQAHSYTNYKQRNPDIRPQRRQHSKKESEALFVMATALSGFGSGSVPAMQSLALCIVQARALAGVGNEGEGGEGGEGRGGIGIGIGIGRLFGALAVLQAVGQMIVAPMIFGLVYSGTVAAFPKAIFVTAAGILVAALALVMLVQSPVSRGSGNVKGKGKRRRAREEVEVERGRSRVSKDLRGGGIYVSHVQCATNGAGGASGSAQSRLHAS